MLYFITGNKNKFSEVKAIIPGIKQLKMDLPEIQSLDAKEIIEYKLKAASKRHKGQFFVEDACLHLKAIGELPGPLIKWFMKTIGHEGLYKIAKSLKEFSAKASVIIGYSDKKGNIRFFEGVQKGKVVKPRGNLGWEWDPIFLPKGFNKTYGEITPKEKCSISMRKRAAEKLKQYLNKPKLLGRRKQDHR